MDERIENCSPKGNDAKAFDVSELEFIAMTDMDVYINGSMKIARKFESPIPAQNFAEKFVRGKWHVEVFNANRPDFCTALHDPKEIWYTKMKRLKTCPMDVGVKIQS
jgi:hypothetical protein